MKENACNNNSELLLTAFLGSIFPFFFCLNEYNPFCVRVSIKGTLIFLGGKYHEKMLYFDYAFHKALYTRKKVNRNHFEELSFFSIANLYTNCKRTNEMESLRSSKHVFCSKCVLKMDKHYKWKWMTWLKTSLPYQSNRIQFNRIKCKTTFGHSITTNPTWMVESFLDMILLFTKIGLTITSLVIVLLLFQIFFSAVSIQAAQLTLCHNLKIWN